VCVFIELFVRHAAQHFALTSGGRGLCLEAEKSQSQIPLQIRPVHIKSLLKFQRRIWGHRTRSVASGRVSEGRVGPMHALLGGVTIFIPLTKRESFLVLL